MGSRQCHLTSTCYAVVMAHSSIFLGGHDERNVKELKFWMRLTELTDVSNMREIINLDKYEENCYKARVDLNHIPELPMNEIVLHLW